MKKIADACEKSGVRYEFQKKTGFGVCFYRQSADKKLIGPMSTKVAAARAMLYQFIETCDRNIDDQNLALMIKYYVTDIAFDVCNTAIQVLGGYGYMHDYPVERYMRKARIFQIFGGTNQIKRKNLAKAIAGKDPESARK